MNFYVNFHKRPQKIGSFLTLKSEIQLIAKIANTEYDVLHFVPGPVRELNEEFRSIMSDGNSKLDIISVDPDDKSMNIFYPENILDELNDNTYYSTARLRFLFRVFETKPSLTWGDETCVSVEKFYSKFDSAFLSFHVGRPFAGQNERDFYIGWTHLLTKLRKLIDIPFVLLGNDHIPPEISEISDVYSLSALGYSIPMQACLVAKSLFFLGVASGMCTPAMLSNIPYIIIKHPKYHSFEMSKELFESRLPWALQNQIFKISSVSTSVLDSWVEEIMCYARK